MDNPVLQACMEAHQKCIQLVQDFQQLQQEGQQQPWIPPSSELARDPLSRQALKLVERSAALTALQQSWVELLSPAEVEVRKTKRQQELDLDLQAFVPAPGPVAPRLPKFPLMWTCKLCPADNTDAPGRTKCRVGKLEAVSQLLKLKGQECLCRACGDWLHMQINFSVRDWAAAGVEPTRKDTLEDIKRLIKKRREDPKRSTHVLKMRRLRSPTSCGEDEAAAAPKKGAKRSKRGL